MLGGHSAGMSVKVNCGEAWVVVIPVLRSEGFGGSWAWVMVCGSMVWVMVCGVGFVSVDLGLSAGVEVMVMSTQVVTGVVIQTFVTKGSPGEPSSSRRLIFARPEMGSWPRAGTEILARTLSWATVLTMVTRVVACTAMRLASQDRETWMNRIFLTLHPMV